MAQLSDLRKAPTHLYNYTCVCSVTYRNVSAAAGTSLFCYSYDSQFAVRSFVYVCNFVLQAAGASSISLQLSTLTVTVLSHKI
jgi:hypothetical protein